MTPLVMVHGFLGGGAQWDGQREALSDTWDVITLDLPGFGENSHLPAISTIEGFADWVITDLHDKGVDQFNLLGHSMGGMIVQEVARRIPKQVEKLVLYATGAFGVLPGRFETITESRTRATRDGARVTARRITASWFLQGESALTYESCAAVAEQASLDAILSGLDAMQSWSGGAALSEIQQSTLIIWGDCDRTYPWSQTEMLWKTIPQTHLAVLPACAHAAHLENPTAFNILLRDYLRLDL
ncbi:alpha/beta fold hydrolase [Litoreibacter roseus]|uniref:Hydrolase n=1 Tax=Litoreibacter roseus TaxID=2601869 RepID=A0A6N6JFP7_9RHOB|nr:alpha/beta fold hydrolase [Litoreibacter roseus]GFE65181.1 hydrolase [Litoreibacter roseus]